MQNKKRDSPSKFKRISRYYIGPLVAFILIFFIGLPTRASTQAPWLIVAIKSGGALFLAAVVGTLHYLQDTKWGPSKRRKMMLKSPFAELFQNGFARYGDVAIGKVQEYTTLVSYTWSAGRSVIKMDILFDIGFQVFNTDEALQVIINRNPPANRFSSLAHEWTRNSIGCKFEYAFKAPSYERLRAKAEELTGILRREELIPMSIDKALQIEKTVS